MKNLILALLFVVAAGLGAYSIHQHNQLAHLRNDLAAAESRLKTAEEQLQAREEADRRISFTETKAKALQDTLTASSAVSAKQSEQVARLEQSLAAAKTNAENKGLAGLLKDPAMKDMMKAQQKMYIGPMIDKMYADLFQQLNLTPDQKAQMKDWLQKKMSVGAEIGMAMLDGSADATKRMEMGKQIKSETDAIDAQMKEFLGEDNFKEFQRYEKSAGDRVVLGQFRDQLAGTTGPLSPAQERQMIDALQEEQGNFKWTTDPTRYQSSPGEPGFEELFNDDRIAKLAEEKERFDQQFLQRARQILSPEQLKQYASFQEAQRQMQISALKLAASMFGQKSK